MGSFLSLAERSDTSDLVAWRLEALKIVAWSPHRWSLGVLRPASQACGLAWILLPGNKAQYHLVKERKIDK